MTSAQFACTTTAQAYQPTSLFAIISTFQPTFFFTLLSQGKILTVLSTELATGKTIVTPTIKVHYQDSDLLIVDKPAGLLTVPGRGTDKQDCLINRLLPSHPNSRIVHRLDMATSGLVIIAQNIHALRALSRQFEQRQIDKEYTAVVTGLVEPDAGEVNLPLICDWPNRPLQKVCHETGKHALTRFQVLARDTQRQHSRLKLKPITGRSHQLRVHMLSLGHAILGDEFYASGQARTASSRLLLHASHLRLQQPLTGTLIEVQSAAEF